MKARHIYESFLHVRVEFLKKKRHNHNIPDRLNHEKYISEISRDRFCCFACRDENLEFRFYPQ